jgi:hypothetical protein
MSNLVPNFRPDDRSICEEIRLGDRVRSYDFEHHDDCYVEGTVEEITEHMEGCPRYRIVGLFRAFDGRQEMLDGVEFFPPVNGTPRMMGGYCNGVRKIAA